MVAAEKGRRSKTRRGEEAEGRVEEIGRYLDAYPAVEAAAEAAAEG